MAPNRKFYCLCCYEQFVHVLCMKILGTEAFIFCNFFVLICSSRHLAFDVQWARCGSMWFFACSSVVKNLLPRFNRHSTFHGSVFWLILWERLKTFTNVWWHPCRLLHLLQVFSCLKAGVVLHLDVRASVLVGHIYQSLGKFFSCKAFAYNIIHGNPSAFLSLEYSMFSV